MFSRILQTVVLVTAMSVAAQTSKVTQAPANLNTNFVGNWTGQLEYRDYRTDERVFLPTWLKITETPDHHSLMFAYVYDDGPAKTVRESVTLTLDAAGHQATFSAKEAKSPSGVTNTTYEVTGFDDFVKTGRGTLVLTGTGEENGKPSAFRITIVLGRNLYTYRKETHFLAPDAAGAVPVFQFRDAYLFTRAEAPGN